MAKGDHTRNSTKTFRLGESCSVQNAAGILRRAGIVEGKNTTLATGVGPRVAVQLLSEEKSLSLSSSNC